jgi:ribosomal protein L16 Arg81 hydroxylase
MNLTKSLCWKIIEDIISSHNERLVINDIAYEKKINYFQTRMHFKSGGAIVIRKAEKAHHEISKISELFIQTFKMPTSIQLLLTPQLALEKGWHYDLKETFILQCHGESEFRLLPNLFAAQPTIDVYSSDTIFCDNKDKSELQCRLSPGDWLYIPCGYWYRSKSITDAFHMSVNLASAKHTQAKNNLIYEMLNL